MQSKAGHDFVEDEYRAMAIGDPAQTRKKICGWSDQIHVARDGLDDDAGNRSRMRIERGRNLVEIVVRQHDSLPGDRSRNTRRRRLPEGKRARTRLDQQAVAVTVIATFELDDFRAAGE